MPDYNVNNPVFREMSLGSFNILGKMQDITWKQVNTDKKAGKEVNLPPSIREQRDLYRQAFEEEQTKLIQSTKQRLELGLEGALTLFGTAIGTENDVERWKQSHKNDKDLPRDGNIPMVRSDKFDNFITHLNNEVDKEVYKRNDKKYLAADQSIDEAKVKAFIMDKLKDSSIMDGDGYITNINGKRIYTDAQKDLNEKIVQELTNQTISSMQEAYDIEQVRALLSCQWDPNDKESATPNNAKLPANIGLQGGSAKDIFTNISNLYDHDGDVSGPNGKPANAKQITDKDYLSGQLAYSAEFINHTIEKGALQRLTDVNHNVRQRKTSKDIGRHPIFDDKANKYNEPIAPRNMDEQRREYLVAASDMLANESANFKNKLVQDLKTNNENYRLGFTEQNITAFADNVVALIQQEGKKGPDEKKSADEETKNIRAKVSQLISQHQLTISNNKNVSMDRFVDSVTENVTNEVNGGFGALSELVSTLADKPLWDRLGTAISQTNYKDNEKIITDYDMSNSISQHRPDIEPGRNSLVDDAMDTLGRAKDSTVKFFHKIFNRSDDIQPSSYTDSPTNQTPSETSTENPPPNKVTVSGEQERLTNTEIPDASKQDKGVLGMLFGSDDKNAQQISQVADPSIPTEIQSDGNGGYIEVYDNPITKFGSKVAAERADGFLHAVTNAKHQMITDAKQDRQDLQELNQTPQKPRKKAKQTDFWNYTS